MKRFVEETSGLSDDAFFVLFYLKSVSFRQKHLKYCLQVE